MPSYAIPVPDAAARAAALERLDGLVKPVGSLGRLEELAAWLSAAHGVVPPRPLDDVRVVVFAGDHGVSAQSAYPREVTAAMVRVFLAGRSGVTVLAAQVGASVRVADIAVDWDAADVPAEVTAHKIRRGSGAIDVEDALAPGEALAAFEAGRAIAASESAADVLIPGDMGIGNTTVCAAVVASALGLPAAEVVGTGTGVSGEALERKTSVVAAAVSRRPVTDPFDRLTALGSACLAATAGFLVEAAVRGIPVLLDGIFSATAALAARDIAPGAEQWWLAGHRSTEPAQAFALKALGLTPILDLGLRLGEGSGAVQAVPALRAARAVIAEMGLLADLG
ncbi:MULTISPECIES: nicotinate-nucleotide--dimethylbenzimidazole phosphoribosyltransferase [Amycolatopsis]|uniref:Nicotinate-nucleotide--dimethylbenzimidazole phosphoribosyltransferase n=3 Tax=Amycolatopsis rubida TaxID=112413 RepID=A0A1I5Z9B1_9PSEU|nr:MULTISPECIES: nicotinate-nucleotide--dimethylbenzimidazole phosphoribosyltransferase [Amycolatopsis]OAP25087.1 Nicotinate-nucleotide--dimethylbenzimidazole phosphoribosyltransferase [Amycolatopsis sp. M39]SFQ52965.1 nicotinate-nucleotide-dimethylbenzimidazole phosphoribosyltransferase [Amycolatopsis rubida]